MKIKVIVENQQTSIPLDINPDVSVGMLKTMLEPLTSTAIERQQLQYNGNEMNNDEKLSGSGVRDGDEITMVPFGDSSSFGSDLGINPDGSAANTTALQQKKQFDRSMMAQLFQEHAQAFSAHGQNGLQEITWQHHYQGLESNYGHAKDLALLQADPVNVEMHHQVLLYGDMEVNGVPVKAMVDTGLQSTVISKSCAERCGLLKPIDEKYEGVKDKANQAEILGRVHVALIKMGNLSYPCSFTVLDSPNAEFLLGLDMLRKHQCIIDLKENVLRVGGGEVCVPFLADDKEMKYAIAAENKVLSHIVDEDNQGSSPGPPVAVSGANESIVASDGNQSAGEAAPGLQVPLGSPASKSPPYLKGYGLKKWRRIKRDIVKDANPNLDTFAGLKRNYTNNNNAAEINQKSEGSVSSTNAFVQNPVNGSGEVPTIEPDNPAYRIPGIETFSPGTDSDNSEDRSSKSSTAASAPKFRQDVNKLSSHLREKHRLKHSNQKNNVSSTNTSRQRFPLGAAGQVDTSKKPRGEADNIEKENSLSSLDSDSRSSNTVFTRGAASYVNGTSERVSGYNEGHKELQTEPCSTRISEDNARSADNGVSVGVDGRSKNRQTTENKDPLVNCIQMLQSAQDALAKEIQLFGDLGKNLHSLVGDDAVKSIHLCSENVEQSVANESLKAKLIELTQKVQILERQAEEAQIKLKEKESTINELEQVMTQQKKLEEIIAEFESLFKAKIEAEIEYVTIKDSIFGAQNQMKLFSEKIMQGRTQVQAVGNLESKSSTLEEEISGWKEVGRMPKKIAFYFCIQLILLIWVGLELFKVRLSPKASSMVIPT